MIDTSVTAKYLFEEKDTPRVENLFAECFTLDVTLWSPNYYLVEITNVIWAKVISKEHSLTAGLANLIVQQLGHLPINTAPTSELLTRALQIGTAQTLPIYDAIFIALAEKLDCPLLTADNKQAQAAQATGISLKALADFPPST